MTDPDVRKSYEILEKIGKGAYGKVYKARAKKSGMIVAIKKIKFSKDDEGIPAPVLREVSILHEMKHEHIVRLLDQSCAPISCSLYLNLVALI
jgi:serine/threonine protein kinase